MMESLPYLFVIAGIVICGWLITTFCQKLLLTPVGARADEVDVNRTIESVRSGLVELRDWLARDEVEPLEVPVALERTECRPDSRELASGLRRRGRTPAEISRELGITQPEVHFLLKVQAAVEGLDEVVADPAPAAARDIGSSAAMSTQLIVQQSC